MDRALELVGARRDRRDGEVGLGDAGDGLAAVDLRPVAVEDDEIVRRARILVVVMDREAGRRRGEGRLIELHALRDQWDRRTGGGARRRRGGGGPCGGPPLLGPPGGNRRGDRAGPPTP